MFFYIHYMLMTSGLSGTSVLLAVFFKTYTDASQGEIGVLLMSFPFVSLFIKPLFCSMADRQQAHRRYMILALIVEFIGYAPFAIIPFFPQFYENHPRASWYILVAACHAGNGGLGVAWSLGDCLAMNMSQKNGTPFGRMRLMGTVSWGVYGFIIGQINEVYFLPKYVPSFFILLASLIAEITLVSCWKSEDFEMVEPVQLSLEVANDEKKVEIHEIDPAKLAPLENFVDSTPGSLSGTLRMNAKTANAFRDILAASDDDLQIKLKKLQEAKNQESKKIDQNADIITKQNKTHLDLETNNAEKRMHANKDKNPQLILLKMILESDGRVIKYTVLFTIAGFLMAPMNFVFLSMEAVCKEKDYNFSQLAGAVLISQATIETIAFLVVPTILCYISRSVALSLGYLMLAARFFFYSGWYYTADISPYWAVIGEWAHGFSYGFFAIILADVSLVFANQSRLFIGELRKLGFLSDERQVSREQIEAEERSIKMALRATMQALYGGFMDGLGAGTGSLICGIFIEIYSYIGLWQMFWIIALCSMGLHQLVELTRCKWSDTYRPKEGTKTYEIMQLSESNKLAKSDITTSTGDNNKIVIKHAEGC